MKPEVHIRRHPRARRIKLRVRRDASIEVVAPPGIGRARVLRFVEQQSEWIERTRERVSAERRPPAERGPFPQRLELAAEVGRVPVVYAHADRDGWQWADRDLTVGLRDRDPQRARSVLVGALKQRARIRLQPRLEALAEHHELRFFDVSWRNQKSRWGSCSSRGAISLNVRLLFLSPPLVEYVFTHELAHLRHPDHSPAFWHCVGGMLPGFESARRAMRCAAARVPEWLL